MTVALAQYGAQWRAIIPTEVEAQLDDLIEGRAAAAPPPTGGAPGRSLVEERAAPLAPGISELLARAEASLADGHCEEYYSQFMSPNFNRATSQVRAQDAGRRPAPTARARARP